jgi:hypothetical protein
MIIRTLKVDHHNNILNWNSGWSNAIKKLFIRVKVTAPIVASLKVSQKSNVVKLFLELLQTCLSLIFENKSNTTAPNVIR